MHWVAPTTALYVPGRHSEQEETTDVTLVKVPVSHCKQPFDPSGEYQPALHDDTPAASSMGSSPPLDIRKTPSSSELSAVVVMSIGSGVISSSSSGFGVVSGSWNEVKSILCSPLH